MHRTIGYLSKRFAQIRPGEGRKVLLTFLYFFLIITAYYLIKPVSRSLVLGELGSRMVPYVDLICALLMGPLVTIFARLVDRMGKAQLVGASFWVVIGVLCLFWRLVHWKAPWIAGAFYVWVAIFSVLVVTLFWLVANDLYRPREAKRLFGFIGSGGILGGVVGSSIAAVGAQVIGTEQLLLLAAGLLGLCWLVVQRLWAFAPAHELAAAAEPASSSHHETFLTDLKGFARLIMQSRYLLLLVAMVGLNKLTATLVYYQLNPFIESTFPDTDARTAFTGMFFGTMNVAAFIAQFFFTSYILRRWGILAALLILPVGVLSGATGLLIWPTFWLAAGTELYDGSLNYSLQQTTKEVLYLPIDRSIRYKVKPFIDMVVFRFGKGIAAIIGIVLLDALHVPVRFLSLVVVPLVVGWIVISVWLRRDYVIRIRTILQARAASRRVRLRIPGAVPGAPRADLARTPVVGGELGFEGLGALDSFLADGAPAARKLALADRLVRAREELSLHAKELLEELAAYETPLTDAGSSIDGGPGPLKAIISDQRLPIARRRAAIRTLARSADQAVVDYLLGIVIVEEDILLRQEAVRGLVKLRLRRHVRLDFPAQPIRRQLEQEVANYQRIIQVAAIYRHHHREALAPDDPVLDMLRVLLEESMEQIFRLLMLLYRSEDIHLIYEQLRAADPYVRADAIELLDNLVDPRMRATLTSILDEDRFLSLLDEVPALVREPTTAYRLLQGAIWDHNCWLSVTTLCVVGRLRLTTMRPELEQAARHTMPMIAKAAQVALHLSTLS